MMCVGDSLMTVREVFGLLFYAKATRGDLEALDGTPMSAKKPAKKPSFTTGMTWRARVTHPVNETGTQYGVTSKDGGRLRIPMLGGATGEGRLMPKMPGKMEFRIPDYAKGKVALSCSSPSMTGWIIKRGSSEPWFDTWTRIHEQ